MKKFKKLVILLVLLVTLAACSMGATVNTS